MTFESGMRTGCWLCISVSFPILLGKRGAGENVLASGNKHGSGVMGCQTVTCSLCREKGFALYSQPFSPFVVIYVGCTRAFSSCRERELL